MGKKYIQFLFYSLIGLTLVSCLEPFDFQSEGFEEVLVVEAIFTDETKSHQVRLTYTYPLDSGSSVSYVENAQVYIEDEEGNRIDFLNESSGSYRTMNDVSGIVGRSYRLQIITQNGNQYESNYQTLIKAPAIDSIYDQYLEVPSENGSGIEKGIQFFLDTHDDTGNAKFFKYELEETYKIRAPFPSYYLVEDGEIISRVDLVHECYDYYTPSGTIIGSTLQNTESKLSEQPLRFITELSQFLRIRYSLLVKQYAISETAYLYYRKLKENNESTGSLFDKQAGNITGNIISLNNPNEPILGFFEVSGKSELRAFFSPRDFHSDFNTPAYFYSCRLEQAENLTEEEAILYFSDPLNNNKQIHLIDDPPPGPKTAIIFYRTCTSCDWYADTTVPDYWED